MALLGKPVVCFGEMEDLLLSLLGRFCISHFSLSSNCKHSDTKRLYSHLLCLFTVWPASCMSEFTFKCKLPFLKGAAVTSFRCELSCFWVGCHVCFETNFIFTFSRPTQITWSQVDILKSGCASNPKVKNVTTAKMLIHVSPFTVSCS